MPTAEDRTEILTTLMDDITINIDRTIANQIRRNLVKLEQAFGTDEQSFVSNIKDIGALVDESGKFIKGKKVIPKEYEMFVEYDFWNKVEQFLEMKVCHEEEEEDDYENETCKLAGMGGLFQGLSYIARAFPGFFERIESQYSRYFCEIIDYRGLFSKLKDSELNALVELMTVMTSIEGSKMTDQVCTLKFARNAIFSCRKTKYFEQRLCLFYNVVADKTWPIEHHIENAWALLHVINAKEKDELRCRELICAILYQTVYMKSISIPILLKNNVMVDFMKETMEICEQDIDYDKDDTETMTLRNMLVHLCATIGLIARNPESTLLDKFDFSWEMMTSMLGCEYAGNENFMYVITTVFFAMTELIKRMNDLANNRIIPIVLDMFDQLWEDAEFKFKNHITKLFSVVMLNKDTVTEDEVANSITYLDFLEELDFDSDDAERSFLFRDMLLRFWDVMRSGSCDEEIMDGLSGMMHRLIETLIENDVNPEEIVPLQEALGE